MSRKRGNPAPAGPRSSAASTASELRLYRRLLRQARPFAHLIGALFLLGLLAPPLDLLVPVPLAIVVDSVAGARPLPGPLARALPTDAAHSRLALAGFAARLLVRI